MSILGEKPLSKSQDGIKIKHRRNIRRSSQDVRYDVQYNQPKKEMINIGDCELIDIRTDQWRFLSINHELPFEENGISFSCINRYIIYPRRRDSRACPHRLCLYQSRLRSRHPHAGKLSALIRRHDSLSARSLRIAEVPTNIFYDTARHRCSHVDCCTPTGVNHTRHASLTRQS